MSYVWSRTGLGALALPTKTTYVAPAPIPAKTTYVAPAPIPAKTITYVAPAPAPTPVRTITPTYVAPALLAAVAPTPAPAPYVAPALVPRTDVLSLVTPIVQPAPYVAPALIPRTDVLSYVTPAAPYVAPAPIPRTDVLSLVTPIAPPAPRAPALITPGGQVATTSVVALNCGPGFHVINAGTRSAACHLNPATRSPNMSLISDAIARAQAARANKPCINSRGQRGVWSPDGKNCLLNQRDHRAATKKPTQVKARPVAPTAVRPGLRLGQRPGMPSGLRPGMRPGTPGGQVVTPSVVALNCGAGQELVNGACQALPGTTISPTTGTVAQPNQGAPGPVTYSQWNPNNQSMVGPAPVIESTPDEDEKGAPPPVVVPPGLSTSAKVGIGVGAAVALWLVLRK